MGLNFFSKVRIFAKSWNVLKNWYVYPLVYFNLTKKSHVIFETKSGLKLKIRTGTTDIMVLTNVWLIQEYLDHELDIKDNDIVLDLGGHIGLFALFASQFCKKGKIFCFEPIKENYDILLENLELNAIKNIIPFNLAVYDDSKKVKIYLNEDDAGHGVFFPGSKSIQADSISLNRSSPNSLKISEIFISVTSSIASSVSTNSISRASASFLPTVVFQLPIIAIINKFFILVFPRYLHMCF